MAVEFATPILGLWSVLRLRRQLRSKRVAIGYIVNPSRRREGIGAEAVLAMLQFCFGYLGIHRVQAFIHPDNAASRKLVEKLGFRCEGRLRATRGGRMARRHVCGARNRA